MNAGDLVITSLETITAFQLNTGAWLFTLDELQSASIAQTQEKVDITGKQGRKLASMKRNKAVTVSGTNGAVSSGLLEQQTGGTLTKDAVTEVQWTDYLTVTSAAATTTYTAYSATTGAEIDAVYVKNADGTIKAKLEQASTAAEGKFTYNPASKALGFYTDIADGTEIVVYYKRRIQAAAYLANPSDKYSGTCTLYIDALGEDACGNIYRIQFYIPKADFNGDFTFDMGDDQTVQEFEAEALAGACGGAADLWTYTVFGANTADYTEDDD